MSLSYQAEQRFGWTASGSSPSAVFCPPPPSSSQRPSSSSLYSSSTTKPAGRQHQEPTAVAVTTFPSETVAIGNETAVLVVPESTCDEGDLVHVRDAFHRPTIVPEVDPRRRLAPPASPPLPTAVPSCSTSVSDTTTTTEEHTDGSVGQSESCFGGFDTDNEKAMSGDEGLATSIGNLVGDEELVARPRPSLSSGKAVSIVVPPAGTNEEAPGGFDVCREYGYKYEYTETDESDCDGDGEEEEEEENRCGAGAPSQPKSTGGAATATSATTSSVPLLFQDVSNAVISNFYDTNDTSSEELCTQYLLGRPYHPIHGYAPRREYESSLLWFTYRNDFPEITPYGITTDAGWGCMLRSAQMLLGHALRIHYRGRDWRPPKSFRQRRADPLMKNILTWFADFPSENECWYSLHNMVAAGIARYEMLPGEWYGPGTACHVLRDLCEIHYRHQTDGRARQRRKGKDGTEPDDERPVFRCFVAQQGAVYRDEIDETMTRDNRKKAGGDNDGSDNVAVGDDERHRQQQQTNDSSSVLKDPLLHPLRNPSSPQPRAEWDTSLLLLIPLRLGLKTFNSESYSLALAHTLSLSQSVGFVGGSPRHALWFYGASSDGAKVYGLDPHTVQGAPYRSRQNNGTVALSDEYLRSVHCSAPSTLNLARIDPSLALGFYCRDRTDFDDLTLSLGRLKSWCGERGIPELFSVADVRPDYGADVSSAMAEMMMSSSAVGGSPEGGGGGDGKDDFLIDGGDGGNVSDEEDDFVML